MATKFTEKEIRQIRIMAQVRLPVDQMVSILGISKITFDRRLKRDKLAQQALAEGRDTGSMKVRHTLYQMAIGQKTEGGAIIPPDFQALKFWAQTQEGFKSADRIEISGPDGKPIETTNLSPEQRAEVLKKLSIKLNLTEDE